MTNTLTQIEGSDGELSFPGFAGTVGYVLHLGPKNRSGRGALIGDAKDMRSAFKVGEVNLRLPGSQPIALQVMAHTEGDEKAYVTVIERT